MLVLSHLTSYVTTGSYSSGLTRTITGVGNFTLTYTYNLRGELTGITDPFAAAVDPMVPTRV